MVADLELLRRWRDGDAAAGQDLVKRYFVPVRRFFSNKASRDPDDLAQTTFLRCVAQRDAFEGRSSFRTFVFSVARNVLYEHYRAKYRADVDLGSMSVADMDPSPSQVASNIDWQRRFFDALRAIPLQMQVPLELYYWEGLSTAEVAEVLELPQGTVKSRLHAARERLRRACTRQRLSLSDLPRRQLPGWARDVLEPAEA